METVFVAIPSLEDRELERTVLNAFSSADHPERVHVGVAIAASTKRLYKKISKIKNQYPDNISLSFTRVTRKNHKDIFGVGRGRLRANSLYGNQDYYLQVDSHTMFEDGWDNTLISLLNDAKREIQSDKVILTAYAGKYYLDNNGERTLRGFDSIPGESKQHSFMYPMFIKDEVKYGIIPLWSMTNSEIARSSERKFLPSIKFNANFAFGDMGFAKNTCISEDIVFFEEEIIQTIELMKRGYSLVYPNVESATIRHFYADFASVENMKKKYKRKDLSLLFNKISVEDQVANAKATYLSYIKNSLNKDALQSYKRYANVDLISGMVFDQGIPKNWKLDIVGKEQ